VNYAIVADIRYGGVQFILGDEFAVRVCRVDEATLPDIGAVRAVSWICTGLSVLGGKRDVKKSLAMAEI
jgi:hypothetical protein